MSNNYVLIDFENVQPKNLGILAAHPFKVLVFIGASQTKVPRHVAVAMQALGEGDSVTWNHTTFPLLGLYFGLSFRFECRLWC